MVDNIEFETAKARVLILSQYFPLYSKALNEAVNYAKRDPSAGLLKCRQILEEICANIWNNYNNVPPPSIYDIFNDEKIKTSTPKRVLNRVHSLRTICNLGIHGEEVKDEDVILSLNHLFVLFNWYNVSQNKLSPLPVAVQPSHSFYKYIKDSFNDKVISFLLIFLTLIPAFIFSYNHKLPVELRRPLRSVYEGIFTKGLLMINGFFFSLFYSFTLVFLTLLLSWNIFRRFRNQDFRSRLLSLQLLYFTVFGLQYLILHVLDYYTSGF